MKRVRQFDQRASSFLGLLAALFIVAGASTMLSSERCQDTRRNQPEPREASTARGRDTYVQLCAACHGKGGTGDGPAAIAMKTPPPDLTTLTKRHDGKFPGGYVGALIKFGRNFAAHGSDDMPVWGTRFRSLDPVNDPTGQHHVDDVVAYLRSLQLK